MTKNHPTLQEYVAALDAIAAALRLLERTSADTLPLLCDAPVGYRIAADRLASKGKV